MTAASSASRAGRVSGAGLTAAKSAGSCRWPCERVDAGRSGRDPRPSGGLGMIRLERRTPSGRIYGGGGISGSAHERETYARLWAAARTARRLQAWLSGPSPELSDPPRLPDADRAHRMRLEFLSRPSRNPTRGNGRRAGTAVGVRTRGVPLVNSPAVSSR